MTKLTGKLAETMIKNEIVNKAVDYIMMHIGENIQVEDIAQHCHYSKFYLNRMFREATGESLHAFIKRVRMEQSAFRLKVEKNKSITDIALDYGYSSSNYSSAFRKHHNISPADFRKTILEKSVSENPNWENYNDRMKARIMSYDECDKYISIEQIEDMFVIYQRIKGNYHDMEQMWCAFCNKYEEYLTPESVMLESTYDDPSITNPDECLYDLCVTADKSCMLKNTRFMPGGKFAVFHFKGNIWEIYPVHQSLLGIWFPGSGYAIDSRYGFDIYRFIDRKTMYMEIDICIPVR